MGAATGLRVQVDGDACAKRIAREIETLSAPPFTSEAGAVTRYAFTEPYMSTVQRLTESLTELGFEVELDPVGNLIARNCPPGVPAVGLGSHCDSVRGGGRYDGILGVLAAVEVARINEQQRLGLPLQIISWVEEEASGFGQMLLGSRVATSQVDERILREDVRSLDDGRTFWEHAEAAGLRPERLAHCRDPLAGLSMWIELHIEQGRVLEDLHKRIGVVEAIAGYVHADIEILGQADHAGATPMGLRRDAALPAAHCALELERLALQTGGGAVATVGELVLAPGVINIVPGQARLSLDIRAPEQAAIDSIAGAAARITDELSQRRGMQASYHERQRVAPVKLDQHVIEALSDAAEARGVPWQRMISGAAHDTMCIAPHVPSAMVFVPCRGGISHSPAESASALDAALGVTLLVDAALALAG